tara:strand:+ start:1146 stop:2696 length:1551 start_codon:yes stop_codon:yes gene_type:complete
MDEEVDLSPKPGALIESLRSLGYTPKTAIADIIDNSITAGAKRINIDMRWNGGLEHSTVTISDNGCGMNEEELKLALRPGAISPTAIRKDKDLGRFGLGMKTASWSIGRLMVIKSRKERKEHIFRWDLDHVVKTERWVVQSGTGDVEESLLMFPTQRVKSGTVVHIARCDKIMGSKTPNYNDNQKAHTAIVKETREHLEMVFHRFLDPKTTPEGQEKPSKVEMTLNGKKCVGWDPFLVSHDGTNLYEEETVKCEGSPIKVRTYILPHRDRLTDEQRAKAAGPKGWNLQQGFYIYRANRLIVSGGWIGKSAAKPEEHTKLARVSVDLIQSMDKAWNLDILKSKARPPANLRDSFGRIGAAARKEAKKAYASRGRRAAPRRPRTGQVQPIWLARKDKTTSNWYFEINKEHNSTKLLLTKLLETDPYLKKLLLSLLRLIAKTIPVSHIIAEYAEDEDAFPHYSGEEDGVRDAAEQIYRHLREEKSLTAERAIEILLLLQPFNEHPEIIQGIHENYMESK